jgi:hypothetical protein
MSGSKVSALVAALMGWVCMPAEAAVDAARTCTEAANALVSGASSQQAGQRHGSSSGRRELRWTTAEGHQGLCEVDSHGRVFEVRVTHFPQPSVESYEVTCSSRRYRPEECGLRGPANVRLEQQLSKASCTEGRSWGVDGSTLWVDNGCSGRFRVTPEAAWSAYNLKCESLHSRHTSCPIKPGAVVTLQRQISSKPCQQGRSWGQSGSELWVENGCRAVFHVRPWGGGNQGFDSTRERALRACTTQASGHRFEVLGVRVIETGQRHFDVEVDARRDRVEIELMCRYQVSDGTARLYGY